MKIVISANGLDLDAPASPIFGRCRAYVFVDSESMTAEGVENPAQNAAGGAGIQAAQFVVDEGAEAVITGNVGPNAFNVIQAAGVPIYLFTGGTVRHAVEAFKAGKLSSSGAATARAHAGMGGAGRGMGMGAGGRRAASAATAPTAPQAASSTAREEESAREKEIVALRTKVSELRSELAGVIERLDRLETGGS